MAGGVSLETPYYNVVRLVSTVGVNFERMDGTAALAGIDPMDLPPHRFFNWAVAWFQERMNQRDFRSWEMQVNRPLPGRDPTSGVWSDEEMGAAFQTFQGEFDT